MENSVICEGNSMDNVKRECVKSILEFFKNELAGSSLDSDQKESLAVAKQCLEVCYEIDEDSFVNCPNLLKIFESLNVPPNSVKKEISPEAEAEAEACKVQGNDAMKDGNYDDAVEYYTKAIEINNEKAIYFCNRAAAFSKLDKHQEAIADCKEAIRLDPTYGKAYGRLGIAYSNISMFQYAAKCYRRALDLDPTNASYKANLKLAEEKIAPAAPGLPAATGLPTNLDINNFMSNPALLNMATQMLDDPSFRNMVSGIMTGGPGGQPNLVALIDAAQNLGNNMQSSNPSVDLRDLFRLVDVGNSNVNKPKDGEPKKD